MCADSMDGVVPITTLPASSPDREEIATQRLGDLGAVRVFTFSRRVKVSLSV